MRCGAPTSPSAGLNLCAETLDGIRNHSWSRPAPMTPEGEVVSWADRIAYVCHDFEDAVGRRHRPTRRAAAASSCPLWRPAQPAARHAFITGIDPGRADTGRIGMTAAEAEALAEFRRFNYERIYLRAASRQQAAAVIDAAARPGRALCHSP